MRKLIRDGKVAVIISPSFGAGWSTWSEKHAEELLFDADIALLVERGKQKAALKLGKARYAIDVYNEDLILEWVPQGTLFRIHEYDGSESLVIFDPQDFYTA